MYTQSPEAKSNLLKEQRSAYVSLMFERSMCAVRSDQLEIMVFFLGSF